MAKQYPVKGRPNRPKTTKLEGRPSSLSMKLIHEKYNKLIQGIAQSWLPTLKRYGHTKEDLAGIIYEHLMVVYKQYNPHRGAPTTFIARVAARKLLHIQQHHETLRRSPSMELEPFIEAATVGTRKTKRPEDILIARERMKKLEELIATFNPSQQKIVKMMYREKSYSFDGSLKPTTLVVGYKRAPVFL